MPKNIPITVDKLRDVIESQRCLYGDDGATYSSDAWAR